MKTLNLSCMLQAVEERRKAEDISAVLYPNDATEYGKELRLKQQYFFVSASMQARNVACNVAGISCQKHRRRCRQVQHVCLLVVACTLLFALQLVGWYLDDITLLWMTSGCQQTWSGQRGNAQHEDDGRPLLSPVHAQDVLARFQQYWIFIS